ncbi:glycosyltransferase family 2 protein [Flavobacterium sp.]|uniref:glycosyltransferase family 2 protein n=1 Tax=Flavobacterium sp. TaxID=239 RepID=UPI002BF7B315|nr:glycosyltransferase [Flavobacterium sp.]HSD06125.1 glycosyltransferase [Flavobacterium sp.]
MDIIIKSFNRPYYLDRCIQSIRRFVVHSDYRIIILDDGTPDKYLKKISEKHSDITILKSDLYDVKVFAIENDSQNINVKVPIDLWINAAKKASEYFVLLEDDIWFTDYIALNDLEISLRKDNVQMLKLFWLGNSKLQSDRIVKEESFFSIYEPDLYTRNPLLYKLFFVYYKFKIRKTLSFLNIYTKTRALNYYSIYSVAGVVFRQEYFLSLWKNHTNRIDEGLQLFNAVQFLNKNKNAAFGRTNKEVVKTSFLSAATNQHKNYENVSLNMFVFNKIINEAWYEGELDVMNNFPKDLNPESIQKILRDKNAVDASEGEWKKWAEQFKQQYTSFGCIID